MGHRQTWRTATPVTQIYKCRDFPLTVLQFFKPKIIFSFNFVKKMSQWTQIGVFGFLLLGFAFVFVLFAFLTVSHATQAGLELAMWLRTNLTPGPPASSSLVLDYECAPTQLTEKAFLQGLLLLALNLSFRCPHVLTAIGSHTTFSFLNFSSNVFSQLTLPSDVLFYLGKVTDVDG